AGVRSVACAAGAVQETLGGAGLLFAPKDVAVGAELVGSGVYDRDLHARVLAGQRRRQQDFAPPRIEARLKQILETLWTSGSERTTRTGGGTGSPRVCVLGGPAGRSPPAKYENCIH